MSVRINSPNVEYNEKYIKSQYDYDTSLVNLGKDGTYIVTPKTTHFEFRTERKVPRLGVMLVGLGGNNGSTVVGATIANKLGISFRTKNGVVKPNYYGSITQSSTVSLGWTDSGREIFLPMGKLLPMVDPDDIVFDGWDISSMNLADAMERAKVFDWDLQRQLIPHMKNIVPRPSIYLPDFIAANQSSRCDNVINASTKLEMVDQIRKDIRDFKSKVDKVIVLWTANTERFSDVLPGLNTTADELLESLANNANEISPSTLFAIASIQENVTFINGSPQNTFVPGVIELANKNNTFICGDDFKSGQTKLKSVLVDFLVSAGLKPKSIVSYNHLGNNDGKNLSAPQQFKSKEISKSNVIDDMVASNSILYKGDETPDHCVVIKYVPFVGDSKRAMDEYTSELMLGGTNTLVIHNTCEDSLLASPIILDLVILAELCDRISVRKENEKEFSKLNSVLSILSYLCKAPLVPKDSPVVNSLFKQRACIENILRACLSLRPINNMLLEHKLSTLHTESTSITTEVRKESTLSKLATSPTLQTFLRTSIVQ